MVEILAPAGNAECARAAIHSGANAIYLGIQSFSARQGATNFDEQSLRDILFEAHLFDVKVYVAMNTAIKDAEMQDFLDALLMVWALGVDAIILQDALLGKVVHELYPDIVLHLSTQAGICSVNGAKFAKECGFSRVILARETPLKEIAAITQIIQTETFVQGALCTCFSGQCYFSSFVGGNSGNRGRCKQPCRKLYTYNRDETPQKNYALSLSDLSVGENICKLIDAGVCSYKIEGRMRRPEYVAAAVRYYRAILEGGNTTSALSNLRRTYNRGNYTKGLAFGQDKRLLSTAIQGHLGEKVGVVKVVNGQFFVESTFAAQTGDAFKILRDGKEIGGASFLKNDKRGFILSSKHRLKNGDGVFVTTDTALNERLLSIKKVKRLTIDLHFHENEYAIASWQDVCVTSNERLQTAQSRPLSVQDLQTCFSKTDGLPIEIAYNNIDLQGNIFIAKSSLNAFRRTFFKAIYEKIENLRTKHVPQPLPRHTAQGVNKKVAVIATDFSGIQTDIAIYKPFDYRLPLPESFTSGTFEKYVYYPCFTTSEDEMLLENCIKNAKIDGIYAENYAGFVFAQQHGLRVFAGTGLNVFNGVAVDVLRSRDEIAYYALSKELTEKEQSPLLAENAFVLSVGDIKLMDLCYCPFGKTCTACTKAQTYVLTDENGRNFPVRRFIGGDGNCRFEVYNCANLIGKTTNAGVLADVSVCHEKNIRDLSGNIQAQKNRFTEYTYGHATRGVD